MDRLKPLYPIDTPVRVTSWRDDPTKRNLTGQIAWYVGTTSRWHVICVPGLTPPSAFRAEYVPGSFAALFWGAECCVGAYADELEELDASGGN